MGCVLSQNVQLALKVFSVEGPILRRGTVTVVRSKDDERLKDLRLIATCGRSQYRAISRHFTPAKNTETLAISDIGEGRLETLEQRRISFLEEDVANSILSHVWEDAPYISLRLSLKKEMRDACHDASTIAVAAVGTNSTAMSHGAEELTSVRDDFMVTLAFNMTDEADTAGIFLVF